MSNIILSQDNKIRIIDKKELLRFLDKLNRLYYVERNYKNLERTFKECLTVKNEKLLIIGDKGYPGRRCSFILSSCYYLAAKELGIDVKAVFQKPKKSNETMDDIIIDALFNLPEKNVIILNLSNKLGSMRYLGNSFRLFCKRKKHRFASTPSLGSIKTQEFNKIMRPLDINYRLIKKYDEKLRLKLSVAKEVHIKTRAGTELWIDVKGIKAISADGFYNKPGTGSNIPAGEVFSAVNSCEGKAVIDASTRNLSGTLIPKKPIIMRIEKGYITSIEGVQEAKILEKSLSLAEKRAKYPKRVRKICEVGIGTNPKAKIIGSMIVDEKVYKTAHIAMGSNYWFGGSNKTIIHYDEVFYNPRIYFDGERIII